MKGRIQLCLSNYVNAILFRFSAAKFERNVCWPASNLFMPVVEKEMFIVL